MIDLRQGDCLEVLKEYPDEHADLCITSPPYDQLRDYHGYSLDLHGLGKELLRVLKPGGMLAMVMQDETKDGKKSLTTFSTILDYCSLGFGLWETLIYHRYGKPGYFWSKRFRVDHEYIPLLVKPSRGNGRFQPSFFDKQANQVPCIHKGHEFNRSTQRHKDGHVELQKPWRIGETKCIGTVWKFGVNGFTGDALKRRHPATFPDQLARNLVKAFSREGDLVLDPMMGSGTVGVVCKEMNRNFIGVDISEEYVDLARERIEKC